MHHDRTELFSAATGYRRPMTGVSHCETHGYFGRASCPVCGGSGRVVLDSERRQRLSKFLSGALRHFPDDAGLALDDGGWTAFGDLVAAVERQYDWADRETVTAVVTTDPNGRFEWTSDADGERARNEAGPAGGRVRAAYGHSVDVPLERSDDPVPVALYHGTAPRSRESILAEGLKPMSRQHVHLSDTVTEARRVGERHAADPLVFEVDAGAMARDGYDITRRGRATYTTDRVAPGYLSVLGD